MEEHLRRIDKKLDQIQREFQQTLARYEGKADAALEIRERLAELEGVIKRREGTN